MFEGNMRNAREITLPANAFSGATLVLSVQPATGGAVHREVISPVQ
jgi:hypothetical protein